MKRAALLIPLLVAGTVSTALAREFEFQPSLAVSEEFTDNVFETSEGRVSDYITRVLPGFSLTYRAPALDAAVRYTFDYRHYARESRGDEITHAAGAKALLTAVDNFFFIDAANDYRRVSLDVARDFTRESLFVNQSDQNVATVSPYFVWRPGTQATLRTGYRYVNTWYREPTGIDKEEHSAFVDGTRELNPQWSLNAGYTFARQVTNVQDYDRHQGTVGVRYEYAENSFLYAQGGGAFFRFSDGSTFTSPFWSAGITHVLDSVTLQADTAVTYTEDPLRSANEERSYGGRVEKKFERGSLSLQARYSEFEDIAADTLATRKLLVGIGGGYEFTPRFKGTIDLTGERFTRQSAGAFPYRVYAGAGISYDLGENFTIALNYSHLSNFQRGSFEDPEFGAQVNRGIVEVRKVF